MHRNCPFKYTTGSDADGLAVSMHIARVARFAPQSLYKSLWDVIILHMGNGRKFLTRSTIILFLSNLNTLLRMLEILTK